jgi:mannosyltransferase OCH1-like enzyme
MTIPKIIHQIAPKDVSLWHPLWTKCHTSWRNQFPDFEFKLWNDEEDAFKIIDTYYPQYSEVFREFPYKIMRLNFIRFALLHQFGGIYADMDIFCYKNFYNNLSGNDLFMIENILSESVNGEFPFEICLMASRQLHPYFLDCMNNSREQFYTLQRLFDSPGVDDEWLCMQITDSSLLIQSRDIHNPKQISLLPYHLYNNRASSYDNIFYTKHMRSSAWNTNYTPNKYFIVKNLLLAFSDKDITINKLIKKVSSLKLDYKIIDIEDFDFYIDYSDGNYFSGNQNDLQLKLQTKKLYQYMMSYEHT